MARRKQNKWRKWQASAAATLTVAAIFQYVRTSDAFDTAYAAANGTDTGVMSSTQTDSRDDVMDEWSPDSTDSYSWNTDGYVADSNQEQTDQSGTMPDDRVDRGSSGSRSQQFGQSDRSSDSGSSSSGNYRSRTGAS
ncbi:hypothetical protein HNR77_001737 [Paenibacillus sp. JGP012]|uniref:hypothetical protein n=1 Tax=Paenibacillus sp. JGP012 TaxID=2735914 RepID=UPI001614F36B|nr:hypothetical protein [Paenibacillus sp. JGP012]MBB6020675.1 hypothetical protein [Paenibacillus sp. JGP012]